MKLIVQMPALNEEKTIAQVIASIPKQISGIDEVAVVVVNDGSTDLTEKLARDAGAVVVSHEKSRGVGAAFRSGLMKSTELGADIIVTIDSDGQFNTDDIPALIAPILHGEADFVTGSRFVDPAFEPEMPKVKRWGNDFIATWVSSMVHIRFYDVSCGFRAYSSNAFLRLVLLGDFTYTHEVFLSLAFAHVPIKEVPVRVRGVREHGKSRVASNLFRYGSRTASIILKTYRDYRPLKFFSRCSIVLILIGFVFLLFLASVKWKTGYFTPHKWSGFAGAAFIAFGLITFIVGVMAEMLDRIRIAVDESLFRVKRMEYQMLKDKNSGARMVR